MSIIEMVAAILKWAVLLAEKFGHSNDDLRAEIERQLGDGATIKSSLLGIRLSHLEHSLKICV